MILLSAAGAPLFSPGVAMTTVLNPTASTVPRRKSTLSLYRRLSMRVQNNPHLDFPTMTLALTTLGKLLAFNRMNQSLFAAADGDRVLRALLETDGLRRSALQLIENIVLTHTKSTVHPSAINVAGQPSLSYDNFDMQVVGAKDAAQLEMLLQFLESSRCHVYSKCQVLQSIRRMCVSSTRAQMAFDEHQGFSRLFALISAVSVPELQHDSFVMARVAEIEMAASQSNWSFSVGSTGVTGQASGQSGPGSSTFSVANRLELSLYLSQQYALLLVQEMFGCVTAAVRKNKAHRERWAHERSAFVQLFSALHQSEVLAIPNAPAYISFWLLWLATEYLPELVVAPIVPATSATMSAPAPTSATAASRSSLNTAAAAPLASADKLYHSQVLSPFLESIKDSLGFNQSISSNAFTNYVPVVLDSLLKLDDPATLVLPEPVRVCMYMCECTYVCKRERLLITHNICRLSVDEFRRVASFCQD
jgi:hypothetical protein